MSAGGVAVVLAQERDRFSREPAYLYLLREEFAEHGTKLRALNDLGDDTLEGELGEAMLDQIARYQRKKLAQKGNQGKLDKARKGQILAVRVPTYGFRYNGSRDGYLVDEEAMPVVRRIFRMIGAEAATLYRIKKVLEGEGVPTPGGGKYWDTSFFRGCVLNDCYRPHAFEEIEELVAEGLMKPEVAARLDPEKPHGIWWFNRYRHTRKVIARIGPDGQREYKKKQKYVARPRKEWVAVPVPDAGIPRGVVDAARDAVKDNRRPSKSGDRFWEVSGGMLRCGACRRSMAAARSRSKPKYTYLNYYRCYGRLNKGAEACPRVKGERAEVIEAFAWHFVRDLLLDPDRLRADLDAAIELERERGTHGDPEREAKTWLDRIAEADRQRARAQDLAVEGLLSPDELRAKLASFEETRETAQRELALLEGRREKIAELEADRDTLLDHLESAAPDELDALTPEERHEVYKVLGLRVVAREDGNHEASIAYIDYEKSPSVCISEAERE